MTEEPYVHAPRALGMIQQTSSMDNTTGMNVYPVRMRKPHHTGMQVKINQKRLRDRSVVLHRNRPDEEQDLQEHAQCSEESITTRVEVPDLMQVKAPDNWAISMAPSSGFLDAPLAHVARQIPAVDHGGLHTYHHQLNGSTARSYAVAVNQWIDLLWNVARSHEVLFHAITCFGIYKESTTATRKSYLSNKTLMLRLISRRINIATGEVCNDGRTLVAIALLAYSDMREGDFEAAETHLRALPLLSGPEFWLPYEWVYIAWIDLRFALLRGQRPTLPFYLPAPYRDAPSSMAQHRARARKLALSNSKHVPKEDKETSFVHVCFQMFCTLHEIGLAWDILHHSGDVPFGTIYGLEYSLRTMQVDIRSIVSPTRHDHLRELILLCIQLQTWILIRFWVPQRRETYIIVLHRAQALLQALNTPELMEVTTESGPDAERHGLFDVLDPSCILWIAFHIAGIAIEHGHACQTISLSLLGSAARSLWVKTDRDMARQLQKWPWLDNWHKSKSMLLCQKIRSLLGLPPRRWQKVYDGNIAADNGARVEQPPTSRSFFGGLEFYAID